MQQLPSVCVITFIVLIYSHIVLHYYVANVSFHALSTSGGSRNLQTGVSLVVENAATLCTFACAVYMI